MTSLQSLDEQNDLLRAMRAGRLKLVYVAPERFRSGAFMDALRSVKIARFVVDEAHCISEWGHDFRPDYLSLREVVELLGNPPLLAATATATKRVQTSIIANLGMRDPLVLVGGFNRPNLHFSVHRCKSENEREEKLTRALPKLSALGGSGLIYCATRKQCEQVFKSLTHALRAAGAGWGDVIKLNGYMVGLNPAAVNVYREVRARYFDRKRMPASTLVGIDRLVHEDLLLEVEVIAAVEVKKALQKKIKAQKKRTKAR